MPSPHVITAVVWEDSGPQLMARVVKDAGTAIAQSDISSIVYHVYDTRDLTTDLAQNSPLTVSSVVFDSLQTDARWTEDDTGYNFRFQMDPDELPNAPRTALVEVIFTPASGYNFPVVYNLPVKPLVSS